MKNPLSKQSGLIILNRPLIVPEMEIVCPVIPRVAGRYRLRTYKAKTGKLVEDTGWFDNLISTIGLNRIGTAGSWTYTYVGAGSTAPNVVDTKMQTLIASSTVVAPTGNSANVQYAVSPYYGYSLVNRRFNTGVATGTVAEVGIGWVANSIDGLYSRSLVLDSGGSPTTIVVLSDEVLDVAYEHRLYMPMTDVAGSLTISGTTYNTTTRVAQATSVGWSGQYLIQYGIVGQGAPSLTPWRGSLGPITGDPTGTSSTGAGGTWESYINNSKERAFNVNFPLAAGNIASGFNIFKMHNDYASGYYQTLLDGYVLKDATKVMNIRAKVAWDRYTPP